MKNQSESPTLQPGDLLVIPDHVEFDESKVDFLVCRMKFLHYPSIVRFGGNIMSFESKAANASFNGKSFLNHLLGDKVFSMLTPTKNQSEPVATASAEGVGIASNVHDDVDTIENPPRFLRHVRVFDVRDDSLMAPKGGLTVAVDLMPKDHKFRFAFAICNDSDIFDKKVARQKAEGRLNGSDWYEVENYDPSISVTDNIEIAVDQFLTRSTEPDTLGLPKFSKVSMRITDAKLRKISYILKNKY